MGTTRLLVENIDRAVTSKELENLFSLCGDVRRASVRQGRGRGFIEMTSPAEARRARDHLNGTVIWGRSLSVRPVRGTLGDRLAFLIGRFI